MNEWRLLITPPFSAAMNMAVDEVLLQAMPQAEQRPVFRLYTWSSPALTVGRFQNIAAAINRDVCIREQVCLVRRLTGGEALFHDHDISYSLVFRQENLALPRGVKDSYRRLCGFLLNFYAGLGIAADFAPASRGRDKTSDFCLATQREIDICADGKKLGGNAQKRTRDGIFQQGSIPLTLDFSRIRRLFAERGAGSPDTIGALYDWDRAARAPAAYMALLVAAFARTFSVRWRRLTLSAAEEAAARRLVACKYSRDCWNQQGYVATGRPAAAGCQADTTTKEMDYEAHDYSHRQSA